MSRRGENIYKRKDGRWEGRYLKGIENSKPRYGYVYARTYREVKEKLQALKDQYRAKLLLEGESSRPLLTCLSGIYPLWLAKKTPHVKESTLAKYMGVYERYLKPKYGEVLLNKITAASVSDYMTSLACDGGKRKRGLSPKTISDTLGVLKSILHFARDNEFLVNDSALRTPGPKDKAKNLRVLSLSEQKQIVSYIKEKPSPSNIGILLSLFSGIRVGELCALTWEDINLKENTMHIHQTMQRLPDRSSSKQKTKIVVTSAKSVCSDRLVPFPEIVASCIQDLEEQSGFFLTGTMSKYIEPRTMEYRFKKLLERCGIEHVCFHTLRHTFATRCIEIGIDAKCVSEILGHSGITITLNRYVHPSMQSKQKSVAMLSKLFSGK